MSTNRHPHMRAGVTYSTEADLNAALTAHQSIRAKALRTLAAADLKACRESARHIEVIRLRLPSFAKSVGGVA